MKKQYIFFILFIISCTNAKKTNWNLNLEKSSKEPYGCYLAYSNLKYQFSDAKIEATENYSNTISKLNQKKNFNTNSKKLCIIISKNFKVDSTEMKEISEFVQNGNYFFVSSLTFGKMFSDYFLFDSLHQFQSESFIIDDTIANQQVSVFFNDTIHSFTFHGLPAQQYFTSLNEDFISLGKSKDGINYAKYYDGDGIFFIHHSPVTFTNYFLLQQNKSYYDYVLSNIPNDVEHVYWQSFLTPTHKSDFQVFNFLDFLKYPMLRNAFLLALFFLILYLFFATKRIQRTIPLSTVNKNESVEFVETVGMLYFQQKNNKNISQKIIDQYLEKLRNKYSLLSTELNPIFAETMAEKLHKDVHEMNTFIVYLQNIYSKVDLSDTEIILLYQQTQKYI